MAYPGSQGQPKAELSDLGQSLQRCAASLVWDVSWLQDVGGSLAAHAWEVCDPMDSSPPRSSVHGILQARILE